MSTVRRNEVLKAAAFLRANLERIDTDRSGTIAAAESAAFARSLWPTEDVFAKQPGTRFSLAEDMAGALAPMVGEARADAANRFVEIDVDAAGLRLTRLVDEVLTHPERYDADGDGRLEGSGGFGDWLIDVAAHLKRSQDFKDFKPAPGAMRWTAVESIPTTPTTVPGTTEGLRQLVKDLEIEVRALEAANARKLTEIDALVGSIAARQKELEVEYNRQRNIGLIGAMFGYPMVAAVSLVEMQRTDRRLTELNAKLEAARKDQAGLAQQAARYEQLKQRVEGVLANLRREELQSPEPPGARGRLGRLVVEAEKTAQAAALVRNLEAQRDALLELRGAARDLGAEVDNVLHRLSADLVKAQEQVDASRKATLDLLKVLLARDPERAALNRLTGMARAELGRHLEPMVERMVSGVREPQLKAELKKRLLKALSDAILARPAAPADDPGV
jgi:hypothetical protein